MRKRKEEDIVWKAAKVSYLVDRTRPLNRYMEYADEIVQDIITKHGGEVDGTGYDFSTGERDFFFDIQDLGKVKVIEEEIKRALKRL